MPFEIPESWVWTTLGNVGEIITGTTPSKENQEYYGGNIPFYKPTDLDGGIMTNTALDTLTISGYEQCRKLPSDSVLVTCIGATIGKVGVIRTAGACNQQINAIVPSKIADYRYIYYTLISEFLQNEILENSSSTTLPIINKGKFSELPFPLPPLNEQQRIVAEIERLSAIVDDIENENTKLQIYIKRIKSKILDLAISGKLVPQNPANEPAIELLRRINPNFRLCDNSHYEKLPNGWCVCLLKDVFEIIMGQSPDGDSINCENGVEFHQGKICFTNEYLLPSGVYTSKPTKIAEANSLLLCVRAPVGILNITKRKICIGRGLCSLKPKYEIDNKYWFYILSAYKDYFEQNATGSTFKAISGDTIKNTEILLPPINEQIRITKAISSLWNILDRITAELL
ncbi:MAG: restriction endonuclease subunit S [Bacteroidales bacterium]|nr:restriction endonuclease subunit S [Bacteroidales bacterium]